MVEFAVELRALQELNVILWTHTPYTFPIWKGSSANESKRVGSPEVTIRHLESSQDVENSTTVGVGVSSRLLLTKFDDPGILILSPTLNALLPIASRALVAIQFLTSTLVIAALLGAAENSPDPFRVHLLIRRKSEYRYHSTAATT